ncbi:hypothetical protein BU17DRAFT_90609 [Hysterangium stoloniferum]|nr:hypothetical protein BU17DRAFT_90609 [Hysterangium stoloniferum]
MSFKFLRTELRLRNPSRPPWLIGMDLAYWWPLLNTLQEREYGDAKLYQICKSTYVLTEDVFRSNILTAGNIIDLIEPILLEPQQAFADRPINTLTNLAERDVFRTMVLTDHIGNKLVTWQESSDQNVRETLTTLEALLGKYVNAYELYADPAHQ